MNKNDRKMRIMIAGPYSSGARTPEERNANLKILNEIALQVFRKGHIPVIGVNNALPLIEIAGPAAFEEIMMPISVALTECCDACLRVGGVSNGADAEVQKFQDAGKPVFYALAEIPSSTCAA